MIYNRIFWKQMTIVLAIGFILMTAIALYSLIHISGERDAQKTLTIISLYSTQACLNYANLTIDEFQPIMKNYFYNNAENMSKVIRGIKNG